MRRLLYFVCVFSCPLFAGDSKDYFLHRVNMAYYQHFHGAHKEHEAIFSLPIARYHRIGFDPTVKFGGSTEFGVSFPTVVNDRVVVTPHVFHNFTADQIGFGINLSWRIR